MNNSQRELAVAILRQKDRLEQRVGALEMFRADWSPDNGALIDILYGLSTAMSSSPLRSMIRGFLHRKVDAICQGTPLEGMTPDQKSSLINAFMNAAPQQSEMQVYLRGMLRPLRDLEMMGSLQQIMDSALSRGLLGVESSSPDSKQSKPAGGSKSSEQPTNALAETGISTIDEMAHTKTTTVALAGAILFLTYAWWMLFELPIRDIGVEGTSSPQTGFLAKLLKRMRAPSPRVPASSYTNVLNELMAELKSRNVRIRGTAYSALGQIGNMRKEVTEELIKCLRSEHSPDRKNAAWAIARNISGESEESSQSSRAHAAPTPKLLSALEQAIEDRVPRVACNAALALGSFGPAAQGVLPKLQQRASDLNVATTFRLAIECIDERDGKAKTRLIKSIGQEDPLLDIGLEIVKRDFGGYDRGGGTAACMCTFS
jgi:hypothetical protein